MNEQLEQLNKQERIYYWAIRDAIESKIKNIDFNNIILKKRD